MIKDLQNIKESLFDAPSEVKEAFNTLVRYFSDSDRYWIVTWSLNGKLEVYSERNLLEELDEDDNYVLKKGFSKDITYSTGGKTIKDTLTVVEGPFMNRDVAVKRSARFNK